MGILGPDVRKIDGESFIKEGEFENQGEARNWAEYYKAYGYKSRVIPNAQHKKFEVWVSEYPSASAPTVVPRI